MKSITKIINDVSLVEKICGLKNVILAKVHNFFYCRNLVFSGLTNLRNLSLGNKKHQQQNTLDKLCLNLFFLSAYCTSDTPLTWSTLQVTQLILNYIMSI